MCQCVWVCVLRTTRQVLIPNLILRGQHRRIDSIEYISLARFSFLKECYATRSHRNVRVVY